MYKLHYPGSKEALDYITEREQATLAQQEVENTFRQRELELRQAEIESKDLSNEMEHRAQSNIANAKLLDSLNKNQ